ncbi:MAG: Hsp70 family protein [Oscillospiraceae bacterium]|jgi:molecular chaperone DnaK|nr:Hsp70 family protein [Oscillospiraceae bacterium]
MIVGIDLGTSTSKIAFVNEDGKVVVIPNKEGELTTPSVVYIKKNGSVTVGSKAKEHLLTHPNCTFAEVKRSFGVKGDFTAHGKVYTPEEIQSYIIKDLADSVKKYTGKDVTGAVITVPACFTDVERKQTIRASELAGIKVKQLVNEPTAAAVDYGMQNITNSEHILVYNLGGGTLDVTVLELFEGVIDVKAGCGNNRLGGMDFDEVLMMHIAGHHYDKLTTDPGTKMQLKKAAIDVMISLSEADSTNINLTFIEDDIFIDKTITRVELEVIITSLVSSTGDQIMKVLSDAKLRPASVQKVLFVGSTTRTPFVRSFVEEKLGIETTSAERDVIKNEIKDNNPELMIVRGAAIQAAIIDGVIAAEDGVVFTDICIFSLGVKIATPKGYRIDPLIQKNVTIPYEYSDVYSAWRKDKYTSAFELYQGESEFPHENTRIGEVRPDVMPNTNDDSAKIEITFSYDVNGLLSIKTQELRRVETATAFIDITNALPARLPVNLSRWEKAPGISKYRAILKDVADILEEFIDTPFFMDEKLYEILNLCDELKADLMLADDDGAQAKAEELEKFLDTWNEDGKELEGILNKWHEV